MGVRTTGKALGGVGSGNYGKITTSITGSGAYSSDNRLAEAEQAARRSSNMSFLNSINLGGKMSDPLDQDKTMTSGFGQGNSGAYRSDTYTQNQVWKDDSPVRQLLNFGTYNSGARARAAYFAGKTISDIYERSLRRKAARR